jgi:DNA-binding transcriptional ArsR family regulator
MATSECPLTCSNFRKVDNRTLPKATLSQHFKILRESGLIRSERKGVEMHNTTRFAELKERFGDMVAAILTTYAGQNSRR